MWKLNPLQEDAKNIRISVFRSASPESVPKPPPVVRCSTTSVFSTILKAPEPPKQNPPKPIILITRPDTDDFDELILEKRPDPLYQSIFVEVLPEKEPKGLAPNSRRQQVLTSNPTPKPKPQAKPHLKSQLKKSKPKSVPKSAPKSALTPKSKEILKARSGIEPKSEPKPEPKSDKLESNSRASTEAQTSRLELVQKAWCEIPNYLATLKSKKTTATTAPKLNTKAPNIAAHFTETTIPVQDSADSLLEQHKLNLAAQFGQESVESILREAEARYLRSKKHPAKKWTRFFNLGKLKESF